MPSLGAVEPDTLHLDLTTLSVLHSPSVIASFKFVALGLFHRPTWRQAKSFGHKTKRIGVCLDGAKFRFDLGMAYKHG